MSSILKCEEELRLVVEDAYRLFSECKFTEKLHVCPCSVCVSAAQEAVLRLTPRRLLSSDHLEIYLKSADFYIEETKGAEFRHFLPRIFELWAQRAFYHSDDLLDRLGPSSEALGGANYRLSWRAAEIDMIDRFFQALFRLNLAHQRPIWRRGEKTSDFLFEHFDVLRPESVLRAIAGAGGQLQPYLNLWSEDKSHTALVQLCGLANDAIPRDWWPQPKPGLQERHLFNANWDDCAKAESDVVNWLLAPPQIARLTQAALAEKNTELRALLTQTVEFLTPLERFPIKGDRKCALSSCFYA